MRFGLLPAIARIAALGAMLLATSCAADHEGLGYDAEANHPISVEPHFQTLAVSFATPAAGLLADDELRLRAFVAAYLNGGNGDISVIVPQGPGSTDAIRYFGERLKRLGVASQRILVGTNQESSRVELRYIAYHASVAPCGGWDDVGKTGDNLPMENFGCAGQHNLAAMVADPRDLIAPDTLGPGDATRRNDVIQKYETGQPTPATQAAGQSVNVSGVSGTQ